MVAPLIIGAVIAAAAVSGLAVYYIARGSAKAASSDIIVQEGVVQTESKKDWGTYVTYAIIAAVVIAAIYFFMKFRMGAH